VLSKKLKYTENPPRKRGIFCLKAFLIAFIFSCGNIFSQAEIKFTDWKQSFGFVKKGEIVTLEYEFKNTGNEPLVISEAKFECSCTSVDYPKQPVLPGQTQKVTVKFDTKSTYDRQDRIVEIFSNAKNSPEKIRFKGVVLKK
jgi:hypothetical protein